MSTQKVLVTGGVRSGKSRHAQGLLADCPHVTYVAPGPIADGERDPEWAARVAAHRADRPDHWHTLETSDVAEVLETTIGAVVIDCLGTWLTAVVDELGVWDLPLPQWQSRFEAELDRLVAAWVAAEGPLVAVTNEVGWGLVSEYASGRVFADLLGRTNQAIAAVSDQVALVVAGRVLLL